MPSFWLPDVPLFDPDVDTVESAIQKTIINSNKNFGIIRRLLYGQLDNVNIRSGGILLEDLLGGLLPQTPEALGTGLNLTANYMGYYDGTDWQAYLKDDGTFYFGGDTDNYLEWDGTTLWLGGHLDAVSGTFEVIGAGDFPDGAKVLIGHSDGEPLFEMYDDDETLRVRLEKDNLSFYTEYIAAVGEDPAVDSELAGMIKGLFWSESNIPEVRIEAPEYCNVIAIDDLYSAKYARSVFRCTSDDVHAMIAAVNLPDTGDSGIDFRHSYIKLDTDINFYCEYGDLLSPQRLVLNSEVFEDHLEITRYDDTEEETYTMTVTPEVSTQAVTFEIKEDAVRYIFYIDGEPVFEIDKTGGGALGDKPCIRMYADLEVEGDIYEGSWA